MVRTVPKPRPVSSVIHRSDLPPLCSLRTWSHCASLAARGRPTGFWLSRDGAVPAAHQVVVGVEIVSALTPERLPGPAVAGVLHAEGFFPLPDAVDVVVSVLFQPADEIACLVEFLAQIGDAAVALRNVVFEFGGVSSRWWEAIQVASASLAARHLRHLRVREVCAYYRTFSTPPVNVYGLFAIYTGSNRAAKGGWWRCFCAITDEANWTRARSKAIIGFGSGSTQGVASSERSASLMNVAGGRSVNGFAPKYPALSNSMAQDRSAHPAIPEYRPWAALKQPSGRQS
jgi:hypothetical protein